MGERAVNRVGKNQQTFSLQALWFLETLRYFKREKRTGGNMGIGRTVDELELMLMTVFYFDPLLTKV